jgi:hypothetical protein
MSWAKFDARLIQDGLSPPTHRDVLTPEELRALGAVPYDFVAEEERIRREEEQEWEQQEQGCPHKEFRAWKDRQQRRLAAAAAGEDLSDNEGDFLLGPFPIPNLREHAVKLGLLPPPRSPSDNSGDDEDDSKDVVKLGFLPPPRSPSDNSSDDEDDSKDAVKLGLLPPPRSPSDKSGNEEDDSEDDSDESQHSLPLLSMSQCQRMLARSPREGDN